MNAILSTRAPILCSGDLWDSVTGLDMVLTLVEREWIEAAAMAEGFDLAGLAAVPDPASIESRSEDDRFAAWAASGAAGEMDWLVRLDETGAFVRGDLRRSLPWARSVLVCAVNYNTDAPRSIDLAQRGTGWIARYAWSGRGGAAMGAGEDEGFAKGGDYHEELLPRLRTVALKLRERFG